MRSGPTCEVIEIPTAEDMRALGRRIAAGLQAGDLLVLVGPLGAGKTTLVQGIGAALGCAAMRRRPRLSSPVATLDVPRAGAGHADAYRLAGVPEIDDLDLDRYRQSVTVVEWGEGLAEGLSEDRLEISIGISGEARTVRISGVGARWASAALAFA